MWNGSSFSTYWVLGSVRAELRFSVSGSRSFLVVLRVHVKMFLELEVFTSLSIVINLVWLLKLGPYCSKCL